MFAGLDDSVHGVSDGEGVFPVVVGHVTVVPPHRQCESHQVLHVVPGDTSTHVHTPVHIDLSSVARYPTFRPSSPSRVHMDSYADGICYQNDFGLLEGSRQGIQCQEGGRQEGRGEGEGGSMSGRWQTGGGGGDQCQEGGRQVRGGVNGRKVTDRGSMSERW